MSETAPSERSLPSASYPIVPLFGLDTLWLQVAGTVCNLRCTHCFISCSPTNHSHEMLDLLTVERYLEQARRLGVKEYYLTGGEPFMNPQILDILEATLRQGPTTVLTNGLLFRPETARRLRGLSDASEYSLDLRISIDGYDAASNDPIRGEGTFQRIILGIQALAAEGLVPLITVTEACEGAATREGRQRLLAMLAGIGLPHPRLKIMPLLLLGAEAERSRSYNASETLRGVTLTASQAADLVCSSSRMVTSRGVYVCPILIDAPSARMGESLEEALRPIELGHRACYTCHVMGLSCNT